MFFRLLVVAVMGMVVGALLTIGLGALLAAWTLFRFIGWIAGL